MENKTAKKPVVKEEWPRPKRRWFVGDREITEEEAKRLTSKTNRKGE